MTVIPKFSELYASIISDLEAEYGESIPTFGKNFIRALATVQAAKLNIYYRYVGFTQKNIWVDTADPELSGGTLERFGRGILGRDPFAAQQGAYDITVTGDIGATIQASTTFKSDDGSSNSGKLFILDVAYTLVSTPDTINVRALEAGVYSKLSIGDTMTSTSPIDSVDKVGVVSLETVQPLSEESIEDYRSKIILTSRLESQGGGSADYILWSLDAQGVYKAYPYAKTGAANEVDVFIEATIIDSTDGKGTPTALILSDVEDAIEIDPDATLTQYERVRRPLGVFSVNVQPVSIKEIDIEVSGFVGLDAAIEALIFTALESEINTIRPFIGGADVLEEKNDILDGNKIISTILKARPGSTFGSVALKVDTILVTSNTFINGDIPHLNSVVYL